METIQEQDGDQNIETVSTVAGAIETGTGTSVCIININIPVY